MGFWKTVISGLVIFALTKVFEAAAGVLPNSLSWLGAAATWLWGVFTYGVTIPLFVLVLAFAGVWYLSNWIIRLADKVSAVEKKARENLTAAKEPEVLLSPEESLVFDAIIYGQPPVDYGDLLGTTKLSRLRLGHAINLLTVRSFISIEDDPYGSGNQFFSLTPEGTAHVVKHDLDKIPF